MNKDLEATLAELDLDSRQLVARLHAAREVAPSRPLLTRSLLWRGRFRAGRHLDVLVAALFVAALAFTALWFRPTQTNLTSANIYTLAYQPTAAAQAAIIASQQADGSWANDFLTRQNAAALRDVQTESARLAYRRAVRYLRTKNLAPLTREEWNRHHLLAANWLAQKN